MLSDAYHTCAFSLKLRPSKQITGCLWFFHGLSLLALSLYAINFILKVSLSLLVVAHAIQVSRHYARLDLPSSIQIIELNARGEWWLYQEQAGESAVLLSDSLVTHYLIVLNFKSQHFFTKSVLIMRDSLSVEDWHRLKMYLTLH